MPNISLDTARFPGAGGCGLNVKAVLVFEKFGSLWYSNILKIFTRPKVSYTGNIVGLNISELCHVLCVIQD